MAVVFELADPFSAVMGARRGVAGSRTRLSERERFEILWCPDGATERRQAKLLRTQLALAARRYATGDPQLTALADGALPAQMAGLTAALNHGGPSYAHGDWREHRKDAFGLLLVLVDITATPFELRASELASELEAELGLPGCASRTLATMRTRVRTGICERCLAALRAGTLRPVGAYRAASEVWVQAFLQAAGRSLGRDNAQALRALGLLDGLSLSASEWQVCAEQWFESKQTGDPALALERLKFEVELTLGAK